MMKINLSDIPLSPGVYTFIDNKGNIIYVGKAKSLRNRLSSYFNSSTKNIKTERMLAAARTVKTIITANEVEAFLLEMNLIKTEQPKYNILLKDSKSFPYVKLTNEDYPRIVYTRNTSDRDGNYFGPFVEAGELREILEYLREAFPLRTCTNQQLNKGKICLKYQVKRCLGPCEGCISKGDYMEIVNEVKRFFKGDTTQIKEDLKTRMLEASEKLQFEAAAFYRDRLKAISGLFARQHMIKVNENKDIDLFYRYESGHTVSVTQVFARGGRLLGTKTHFFSPDEDNLLERFIVEFYNNTRQFPDIVVAKGGHVSETLSTVLSQTAGRKILMRDRGYANLIDFALRNAQHSTEEFLLKSTANKDLIPRLARMAGRSVSRIECIDISHLGGDNTVGVSIVYDEGVFEKKSYRKYRIKSAENNDVQSIREVMIRKMENVKDLSETEPDLYLIDGGVSQLNAAFLVLKEYNSSAACLSISEGKVKEISGSSYSTEEIHEYGRKNPIKLRKNDPVLLFLQKLRDEAHRFAIAFSRKLSLKKAHVSAFLSIDGVGAKRAKSILTSIPDIYSRQDLSAELIRAMAGVPLDVAEKVCNFVNKNKK